MEQKTLTGVTADDALRFFYWRLRRKVRLNAEDEEIVHVSSVLANYTLVSRNYPNSLPSPAGLSEVFDNFVYTTERIQDPEILEHAAGQTLFLNGFFRRQMERRHQVKWYDRVGSSFYHQLSLRSESERRRKLFERMSARFPFWTLNCYYLAQDFHPQWKPQD